MPVKRQTNDAVHLAITPACGKLGGTFTNANAGVVTTGIKTLVAFVEVEAHSAPSWSKTSSELLYQITDTCLNTRNDRPDSYTFGGRSDGGPLSPAVLNDTNPLAGGRGTDGPVWAEDLASDFGATIKDYAERLRDLALKPPRSLIISLKQFGAVVLNVAHWPNKVGASDFPPASLRNGGISSADGNQLPQAADLLTQIKQLAAAPTYAKNIVVLDDYGRGSHLHTGDAFKQAVFAGLTPLRTQGFNVAYVDFTPLWDAVLGTTSGLAAFGYETSGSCIPTLDQKDLSGECSTPLNAFYWLPKHPSKETHRVMAVTISGSPSF
ncbi:hypothetical protein MVEN_00870100 [Mycena venus]|uniref:Carbohydrate esterase family 16 protein n=1 Tax=Mycena venus TaxID=2733690 RepID=A0A8H6YFU3_9AGAR|nr:hypothetical protein MVEN_00870100 [Mycena venus]